MLLVLSIIINYPIIKMRSDRSLFTFIILIMNGNEKWYFVSSHPDLKPPSAPFIILCMEIDLDRPFCCWLGVCVSLSFSNDLFNTNQIPFFILFLTFSSLSSSAFFIPSNSTISLQLVFSMTLMTFYLSLSLTEKHIVLLYYLNTRNY
jgi:hypothetical protein